MKAIASPTGTECWCIWASALAGPWCWAGLVLRQSEKVEGILKAVKVGEGAGVREMKLGNSSTPPLCQDDPSCALLPAVEVGCVSRWKGYRPRNERLRNLLQLSWLAKESVESVVSLPRFKPKVSSPHHQEVDTGQRAKKLATETCGTISLGPLKDKFYGLVRWLGG